MAKNDHSTRVGNVLAHFERRKPGSIVAAKAVNGRLVEIPTFAVGHVQQCLAVHRRYPIAPLTSKLQDTGGYGWIWACNDVGNSLAHIECREVVTSERLYTQRNAVDYLALLVLYTKPRFKQNSEAPLLCPVTLVQRLDLSILLLETRTYKELPMSDLSTDRLAFRVFTLAKATGLSQSHIKKAIYEGKLRAYKQGTATLILAEDARAWITERPAAQEVMASSEAVK